MLLFFEFLNDLSTETLLTIISIFIAIISLIVTVDIAKKQKQRELYEIKICVIDSVEKMFEIFKNCNKCYARNKYLGFSNLRNERIDYDKLQFQIGKVFEKALLYKYVATCQKCRHIEVINNKLLQMYDNGKTNNTNKMMKFQEELQSVYQSSGEIDEEKLKEYDDIFCLGNLDEIYFDGSSNVFSELFMEMEEKTAEIEKYIDSFILELKSQVYYIK